MDKLVTAVPTATLTGNIKLRGNNMFNIKGLFKKKKNIFYQYFLLIVKNIVLAADIFLTHSQHLNNPSKAEDIYLQIKTVEQMGDQYTHEVILELSKSFITPLEREDIMKLTLQLDDVLDCLEVCASRLVLYNVKETDDHMRLLIRNIQICVQDLYTAVELLTENRLKEIPKHTHRINDLENAADELLRDGLRTLFATYTDPIEIMKKKEIYILMESFSDYCEDVADILEGIIMRNS
jgi:predicted phosphate transport protein (TIGR00153 family)